ncbi:hypothetical protein EGW08_021399 [Elysia chlorotica]|uniref:Insulin-like domain-containing protein n=1 Tax=Elysia chlorotica TaxID=188477 RepID=A0A3S1BN08_ELYCH|nr:hypothetical protein EGW08_021399 [Elysia chlorotica]
MHHSPLLDVCVIAILAAVLVLAPNAEARQRPGEAPERVCSSSLYQRPAPGGVCGNALTNRVQSVCRDMEKRSGDPFYTFTKADWTDSFGLQKRDAFGFLQKRTTSMGLTCECCYNVCTTSELQEYCPLSR